MVDAGRRRRGGRIAVAIAVGVVAVLGAAAVLGVRFLMQPGPGTSVEDPPVLAGQQLWGTCAGGFYARLGEQVVVTSSGHCATEGTVAYGESGTVRGVFGPSPWEPECQVEGHRCAPSDMNYLVVAEDQVPWGRLNTVDLGSGGLRAITAGTAPLACGDIDAGDEVEMNGRNVHRSGSVEEKGEYLRDDDGDYFPCMVAARLRVEVGDSGAGVLVGGIPGGVASRSFDGWLGFTPLAEGLARFGLVLCTTPNCDLVPPSRSA